MKAVRKIRQDEILRFIEKCDELRHKMKGDYSGICY